MIKIGNPIIDQIILYFLSKFDILHGNISNLIIKYLLLL